MKRMPPPLWSRIDRIETPFEQRHHAEKVVMIALLSAIAALFQSMGGFIPGIGYLFSPLTTGPIFLATWLYPKTGALAYLLTIGLLAIIQPSELFVYPFTTGVLGLVLGWTVRRFKQRLVILCLSAAGLTVGINVVLVVLQFPLLGPITDTSFNLNVTAIVFVLSFFYSWLWLEGMLFFMKRYFNRRKTPK